MSSFAGQRLDQTNWIGSDAADTARLDAHAVADLFSKVQRSEGADTWALNELLIHYLPIVTYQANRLTGKLPPQVEADDLVQAGYFGLRDAILAFDSSRGIKFETYCVPRVAGSMLDSIRGMDWVPRLVRRDASIVKKASDQLRIELDRDPNESELIEYLRLRKPESLTQGVIDIISGQHRSANETVSLSKVEFETDSFRNVHVGDLLADSSARDPGDKLANEDLRRALLKGLNKAQRLIYVLYVIEELPMKEVGMHLDLSESRVSQMFSEMIQIWQDRVESAAGTFKDEFSLIAAQFRVSRAQEEHKEDISQEVIRKLDEINALSAVSFLWREKGEDYQSEAEEDPAVQHLIEKAAELRPDPSLPHIVAEKEVVRSVRRGAIPMPRGQAASTEAFGFIFQGPQIEQDLE